MMKYCPDHSSRFRILKGGRISLVVSALIVGVSMLQAAPSGGVVTSGSAVISQSGNATNIAQSSNKASINWQNFGIKPNETVNFAQPNASSITLNRVIGNERSVIDGAINANGQVWILNSNGVLFGKNASINTAGLLATTKELSDRDFQADNYAFTGSSTESIINLGQIDITNSGYAALLADSVSNKGTIRAVKGKVHLVGASEVTINLNGNSIVELTVQKGILDALVQNKGAVYADGGEIYLTTNAVDELLRGVVNNTGIIEAKTLDDVMGKIVLFAHGGKGEFGGSLSTGSGEGFIETSGKEFVNDASLHVQTGEWLIDPVNITIDTALAGTISTALGSGNVKITTDTTDGTRYDTSSGQSGTDGDIFVNSGITWSSGNALTLHADRNILINAAIDASGGTGGRLVLEYGQGAVAASNPAYYLINAPISLLASGVTHGHNGATSTNFGTKLGSDGTAVNYTTIASNDGAALNTQLGTNLSGDFALSTNIALSGANNWTRISTFTGSFEGLGHTIDGLNIVGTDEYVGLFGQINDAYIGNITLSNATVEGNKNIGALVGAAWGTTSLIVNASSSGSVVGVDKDMDMASLTGGLVGKYTGKIISSHSSAEVSLKAGSVGGDFFGGLVGSFAGTMENSYATGKVSGKGNAGGLVGILTDSGTIKNSYATGEVAGSSYVGGLLGTLITGTIQNSYAKGKVTGTYRVGGFAGQNQGTISNSYSTGLVAGTTEVGGFVGYNNSSGVINNSFWDKESSGQPTNGVAASSAGTFTTLSGKTTAQMTDSSTFTGAGWDTTIWSFPTAGAGATVAGYQVGGGIPYLTGVTRTADIVTSYTTLFEGGMGTSASPYTITNWTQLQNINYASDTTLLSKYYTLSNNIDNTTAGYTNSGAGFVAIGTQANRFKGTFDGLGHTITGLFIDRPTTIQVGLFGFTDSATIRNIGIVNANITGQNATGGLAGLANNGTITNAYATGSVTGSSMVGGLVGTISGSTITNSYATVDVIGSGNEVGGLVGGAYATSTIANSYATGSVTGVGYVGGLVGILYQSSTITNSYATGSVTGTTLAGGLLGGFASGGAVTNSYWDTQTSGKTTSSRGVGKTTAEMQTLSTFVGWDIAGSDGAYPTLTLGGEHVWTMTPSIIGLSYTLGTQNQTYNGSIYNLTDFWSASSIFGAGYASWVLGTDYTFVYNGSSTTGFKNAGTYSNITIDVLKIGYTEAGSGNTAGALTIAKKALTLTALAADNKTYDGTTGVTISNWGSLDGLAGSETLVLGHGTASFDTAAVGNGKTVTAVEYTLSDGSNGGIAANYSLAATATTTANITAVPTQAPTEVPTEVPTQVPTQVPTEAPTQAPTEAPTQAPTLPSKPDVSHIENGTASFVPTQILQQTNSKEQTFTPLVGARASLPSWGNGSVAIINGGVRLPDYVEQEEERK